MSPMLKQTLYLQWKIARWPLVPFVVAAFGGYGWVANKFYDLGKEVGERKALEEAESKGGGKGKTATTSHAGQRQVTELCRNCGWTRTYMKTIPRIQTSSGSSSGGGGSRGGLWP